MSAAHVLVPLAVLAILFAGYLTFFRLRAGGVRLPNAPRFSRRVAPQKALWGTAGALVAFAAAYAAYTAFSAPAAAVPDIAAFAARWLAPLAVAGVLIALLVWLKAPAWMAGTVAIAAVLYTLYPAQIREYAAEKERTGFKMGPPDFSPVANAPAYLPCAHHCTIVLRAGETPAILVPRGASVCFEPDVIWAAEPRIMLHLWYRGKDLGLVRMTRGMPETYDRFTIMRFDRTLEAVEYWFTRGAYC